MLTILCLHPVIQQQSFVEMLSGTFENVVYHANLYGIQKNKHLCLTLNELYKFIGISMIIWCNVLSSWKDTGVAHQICTIL